MIEAKIVADSINQCGNRITTFVLTYPRIIHSELMTHREFSRNSASSRAIPFKKMLKMVDENPFIPMKWMKDHKGMQGVEYFEDENCKEAWLHLDRSWGYGSNADKKAVDTLKEQWLDARNAAMISAEILNNLGVTKQLCNRLLEPFMYHTTLVTATEYENFYALRLDSGAEIHIQKLANVMLEAQRTSIPNVLSPGDWHIPFGDTFNEDKLNLLMPEIQPASLNWWLKYLNLLKVKIATARCARVSYLNFEGTDDYEKDITLHDDLISNNHWSPTEHCAMAMEDSAPSGNFKGWKQYRKFFDSESQKFKI